MSRTEINFLKTNGYYPFPKMLQIEITRRCPFHCSQCYKQKLECIDIDYGHVMNLLEMIKQKDVRQFVLNGGEPLLYPNIVPLLKQISGMEISVNIFTSGYGLTKEIINILKIGKNINFYISLNGSTQKINSQSREGYEYAINAVMMLAAENAVYGINWVARHDNTPDFANMISLCREYNAYIPFSYR